MVALRKESVDRNLKSNSSFCSDLRSLSARRAWIEMWGVRKAVGSLMGSLSARRAWIEIMIEEDMMFEEQVALRKESVDRNNDTSKKKYNPTSLSARRAWIEILVG